MNTLSKGELTRLEILNKVRQLFNDSGVDHTIAHISKSIGMGKSRITNYYPQKEDLIIGLLRKYDEDMTAWASEFLSKSKIEDFRQYLPYLLGIMELMFEYRGVISHSLVNPNIKGEIVPHVRSNYERDKRYIQNRIKTFVDNGLLEADILKPEALEVYLLHFLCMASNWTIIYNVIDTDKEFQTVKLRYLRSVLCCLMPYLTEKGRESMAAAFCSLNGDF